MGQFIILSHNISISKVLTCPVDVSKVGAGYFSGGALFPNICKESSVKLRKNQNLNFSWVRPQKMGKTQPKGKNGENCNKSGRCLKKRESLLSQTFPKTPLQFLL